MKIDIKPNFNFRFKNVFKGKKNIYLVLGFLLLFLILLFNSTHLIATLQWFGEVGYTRTYLTRAFSVAGLTIPIFFVFYFVSIFYYKSIAKKYDQVSYPPKTPEQIKIRNRFVYIAVAVFFGIVSYGLAKDNWYLILQFINGVDFNVVDPVFGKDISFYVFRMPLYQFLVFMALSVVVLLIILTVVIYLIIAAKSSFNRMNFRNLRGILHVLKNGFIQFAGKALAMLISLYLILLAVSYYLDSFLVMFNESGVVYGPGYTDVNVNVPILRIMAVISAVSALVVAYAVQKRKINLIGYSILLIFGLSLLRVVAYVGVEGLIVNPNQLERERPYILNNINMTRQAFGIQDVEIRQFEANQNITPQEVTENRNVVDSIKVNSYRHTLDFIKQAQVIRSYYDFNDVDVDRYMINGEKKQVFLAPREIDRSVISPATWQNIHLFYTHGYGVVLSDSSTVTSQGQPDFLMKDIPTTNLTDISVENPRIYFGEMVSDYIITGARTDEFDHPRGGENETYRYTGGAGIKLSFLNRILYAIEEKEPKILISSLIDSNSKIIRKRNIVDRVRTIAPFLHYDEDPYIVLADNQVYWMMDGYTTTDKYPNARTYEGINYIRNSVKVTINAYTGEVNFYLADENDPIAITYNKIFGDLFKDLDEMPEVLRDHIKYPEDLFAIQTTVLEEYHVTDPGIFYNGEDTWQKSAVTSSNSQEKVQQDPYSLFTSFGDEDDLELVFTEYYTVKGKENMVAIVNVRMEKDHYGQLVEYKFPPQKTVSSPYLFRNKLNQDPEISKELSLLDSGGSKVEFGDMVITPIEDSLLYVVPVYLVAEGENSIPEVKRFIVSNDNQIVISDTFNNAIGKLFSMNLEEPSEGPEGPVDETLARKANDLFAEALTAQRAGNWAEYGRLMEELQKVLEEMLN
ncbi:UPF0182 family protein [Proteiniclasticum ruminis]|uniref:UPF0182 protein SAMN05421804_10615 n=1 Tax=Proteiniclasticum ruminis TaxID=398199 RepID=A0A1G8Q2N1_9CLOT|nr:UPF0182 family protein [Proteiniclasticum ruminis]SDI99024.1 hypothetical protein SAMN05421804_10615 [Proteiniclasticum ruminis]